MALTDIFSSYSTQALLGDATTLAEANCTAHAGHKLKLFTSGANPTDPAPAIAMSFTVTIGGVNEVVPCPAHQVFAGTKLVAKVYDGSNNLVAMSQAAFTAGDMLAFTVVDTQPAAPTNEVKPGIRLNLKQGSGMSIGLEQPLSIPIPAGTQIVVDGPIYWVDKIVDNVAYLRSPLQANVVTNTVVTECGHTGVYTGSYTFDEPGHYNVILFNPNIGMQDTVTPIQVHEMSQMDHTAVVLDRLDKLGNDTFEFEVMS